MNRVLVAASRQSAAIPRNDLRSVCSGVSEERRHLPERFPAALCRNAATPRFAVPVHDSEILKAFHEPSLAPAPPELQIFNFQFSILNCRRRFTVPMSS